MAALLYLPRLFVYHTAVEKGSAQYQLFLTMERRLILIIMNPAAALTFLFGFGLVLTPGVWQKGVYWLHVKILLVIILGIGHGLMVYWHRQFRNNTSKISGNFFRLVNEIPALLMIGIVILAVVRPF